MNKNVTFIEDLIDVDSIQDNRNFDEQINKKYIRQSHPLVKKNKPDFDFHNKNYIQPYFDNQQPYFENRQPYFENQQPYFENQQPYFENQQPYFENQQPYFENQQELSCISISNHIKNCPICSKFYNIDNSIYIICIVLLIIICIILLKKIIEK
jgi:hypothetical protein